MKILRTSISLVLLLITPLQVFSQRVITGKIIDGETKAALPGALISINNKKSTTTNRFGFFELAGDPDDTLIISKKFYTSALLPMPDQSPFQASLSKRKEAEFPGGFKAFSDFMFERLRYPADELKAGIEGIVYVTFTVDSSAMIGDIRILEEVPLNLRNIVIQAIQSTSHEWLPALSLSKFVLPVVFRIGQKGTLNVKQYDGHNLEPIVYAALGGKNAGPKTVQVTKEQNGIREEFFVLKDDRRIKHGRYQKFESSRNNKVIESGTYVNDKKNFQWVLYHADGAIKESILYKDGREDGPYLSFMIPNRSAPVIEKGVEIIQVGIKPQIMGQFKNGKRTGIWTSFNTAGDTIQKIDFDNQILIFDSLLLSIGADNQNRPPVHIGGASGIFNEFVFGLEFQLPQKLINTPRLHVFKIHINADGVASETEDFEHNCGFKNCPLKPVYKEFVKRTANKWLPPLSEGRPTEADVYVKCDVSNNKISIKFDPAFAKN